jgi:hypothetical protein
MIKGIIIIIVIGLVVIFLIIKFITKLIIKLIAFVVVAILLAYFLLYWRSDQNTEKKNFVLYDLQTKYCIEKHDTVKCDCIINPLISDIQSKYKPEEINASAENPLKSVEIIVKSLEDNKEKIKTCLKDKNATHAWDDFIKDLKSLDLEKKIKDLFNDF